MSNEREIDPAGADGEQARRVRRNWFKQLPEGDQDAIVKPHFESAHPTNADIRRAIRKYGMDVSDVTTVFVVNEQMREAYFDQCET